MNPSSRPPAGWTGAPALLLFGALAGAAGLGCNTNSSVDCPGGSCGAVSVGWRVFNQTTGERCDQDCRVVDHTLQIGVQVDQVALEVTRVGGGACAPDAGAVSPGAGLLELPRFACRELQGTTRFTIPAGRYRLALQAYSCGVRVGNTPPPVLRDVCPGEITNLQSIEIAIPPCQRLVCNPSSDAQHLTYCDAGLDLRGAASPTGSCGKNAGL